MRPSNSKSSGSVPSSGSSLSTASKSLGMPSSSLSSSPRSRGGRSAPSGPNSGSVPPATARAITRQLGRACRCPRSRRSSKRVMSSSTSSSSSYIRRSISSRSATTSQRSSPHDDVGADRGDVVAAVVEVPLVDVVEQRGEVLAAHLAGDGHAHEGQDRRGDVVRGGVPVDVVAGPVAVGVADQERHLVGGPVRGRGWRCRGSRGRRARCPGRRSPRAAWSRAGRAPSSVSTQPPDRVVDRLHVLARRPRAPCRSRRRRSSAARRAGRSSGRCPRPRPRAGVT